MRWLLGSLALALVASSCVFDELTSLPPPAGSGASGGGGGGTGAGDEGGASPVPLTCEEFLATPLYNDGCATCARSDECCAFVDACARDEVCVAFVDCLEGNFSPFRIGECAFLIPSGNALYEEAWRCLADGCRDECLAGNWACVEDYDNPQSGQGDGIVHMRFAYLDEGDLTDFVVRACEPQDVSCANPVAEVTPDPGVTEAYVPIDFNFFGYFELEHPDHFPTLYYPPVLWHSRAYAAGAPRPATYAAILDGVGLVADPTHGQLAIGVQDCHRQSAAGVAFSISGPSITEPPTQFYVDFLLPVLGATETTGDGRVVWINVPPGSVTYSGVDTASGEEVVRGTVQVRAGAFTVVEALPRASP